jgi:hypothetical protein
MQQRRQDEQLAVGIIFGMLGAVAMSGAGLMAFMEITRVVKPPPTEVAALPEFVTNSAADVETARADALEAATRGDASAAAAEAVLSQARAARANPTQMPLPDGAIFEGQSVGGQGEGMGFVTGRGLVQAGYFMAGQLNGDGALCERPDCAVTVYVGGFRDGVATGAGKLRFPDGSVYRGDVRAGVPYGFGIWSNAAGDVYEGGFEAGKRSGHGHLKPANGPVQAGFWKDDQLIDIVEPAPPAPAQ